jgi:dephospho-CoA kinase
MKQQIIPVLIGLPGSGKTTNSKLLAKKFKLKIFSSDEKFREIRKLWLEDAASEAEILHQFVARPELTNFREWLIADLTKSNERTEKYPLPSRSGEFIRKYSEEIFRALEIEMLKYYLNR